MAQAFVTGGSGFIGRALIRRLITDGHTVRAIVRSDHAAETVAALGAEPVRAELADPSSWSEAARGSDVLFHLAAETDVLAPRDQQERVTVGGTAAALEAAQDAGVPTFVLVSSESALLVGAALVEVDETAPLRPDSPAAYPATKAESEALVLAANAPGFRTVAIRPRFVWGPESGLIDGVVEAARSGAFAWIDGGRQTTDVTHVDNAVEGLVLGWRHGEGGQAYFVTDEHRVVFRDFITENLARYGVEKEFDDISTADAEASLFPIPVAWFFGLTCTLKTDKARAVLGYRPVIDHEAGFDSVKRWLATREA